MDIRTDHLPTQPDAEQILNDLYQLLYREHYAIENPLTLDDFEAGKMYGIGLAMAQISRIQQELCVDEDADGPTGQSTNDSATEGV